MNHFQPFKMAFRSIIGNKLRSFLTMLGIIIGVASVIVLVSIGQGSSESVTNEIASLGTNLITVNIRSEDLSLTEEDIDTLNDLDSIEAAAPYVQGFITAKNGAKNTSVQMIGATSSYATVKDTEIASGRFISDIDVDARNRVAVIGSDTATTLFGMSDPVGEEMQIDGITYEVIGVLEPKGSSSGDTGDELIIVPLTTAQRALQSTEIQNVYLQSTSEDTIDQGVAAVEMVFSRLFPGQADYYSVTSQKDLITTFGSVSSTMTKMLAGIASISLLVGGIGIMNILLVSVTERTKEIGIRKAIGAKHSHILYQFLIEAIMLSAFGGILGVIIGVSICAIISSFTTTAIVVSMPVIAISFGFSILVGIVFGVFPANKAARLHPIQALRFD